MDLAPATSEAKLLLRGELLVAEEDRAIVEQGRANFRQHIVRQVLGQIDPRHLGAERAGDAMRFEIAILGVAWSIHGKGLLGRDDTPEPGKGEDDGMKDRPDAFQGRPCLWNATKIGHPAE